LAEFGSLGFAVMLTTYGGDFCDFPKNHPKIWGITATPNDPGIFIHE